MENIFVLCFQKDRGLRLSPKHPEARRHTGLCKLLALNEGSRPRRDARPVSAVCVCNGGMVPALTLSMSPQGRETPLQPVRGHNQHRTGGKKCVQVRGGLKVKHGSSELQDDPRTKSSEMETLFFWVRPKMSIPHRGLIYKSLRSLICVLSAKVRPLAEHL